MASSSPMSSSVQSEDSGLKQRGHSGDVLRNALFSFFGSRHYSVA